MILFKTIAPVQEKLQKLRDKNATIGFVPTMGALHKGHLALIKESKKDGKLIADESVIEITKTYH